MTSAFSLEQATSRLEIEGEPPEELVAELSPRPDAPTTMRKLPKRREKMPTPTAQLGLDRVVSPNREGLRPDEPLAPAHYKVQFTASAEFHTKLERLRALMGSSVPDGDLGTILEEAVTEKLERLESKHFAKTKAPTKSLEAQATSHASRRSSTCKTL